MSKKNNMFTFLQEITSAWSGSTATRLVDACRAHLAQKQKQLEIATTAEEHAQRVFAETQQSVEQCTATLEQNNNKFSEHVDTHALRLKNLAKAIMSISHTTSDENLDTIQQVMKMAGSYSADAFVSGVDSAKDAVATAETSVEAALIGQRAAKKALVLAKEHRTTLEQQITEIESIRSQLHPEHDGKKNDACTFSSETLLSFNFEQTCQT